MYAIGELVVYSKHGLCRIEDICDKKYGEETQSFYVLRPENDKQLTINLPGNSIQSSLSKLINKEQAEELLEAFKTQNAEWIEKPQTRNQSFQKIIVSGNRLDVVGVTTALIKKQSEAELDAKKFSENDIKHLQTINNTLFKEIAFVLDKSQEEVSDYVYSLVNSL